MLRVQHRSLSVGCGAYHAMWLVNCTINHSASGDESSSNMTAGPRASVQQYGATRAIPSAAIGMLHAT